MKSEQLRKERSVEGAIDLAPRALQDSPRVDRLLGCGWRSPKALRHCNKWGLEGYRSGLQFHTIQFYIA
jgi:hypothetical protein